MFERLTIEFLGKKLTNPLVLPSGVMGISYSGLLNAVHNGAGVVTAKSLSLKPRKGHPGPVFTEFRSGIINSMGLCNPGIKSGIGEISEYKKHTETPLIISVFGATAQEFIDITKHADQSEADFIELNLSCPNVSDEYGVPLSASKEKVREIICAVRDVSEKPIIAKLSPNTYNVKEIAKTCEDSGADALTLINGLGPGMMIDIDAQKPVIKNKFGGVSGPAIKPIAVKLVYEIHKTVSIPIIGVGGVLTGRDAVEMLLAGATLVGIGSGVYYRGIEVYNKVNKEILQFMDEKSYQTISDIKPIH